MYEIRPTVRRVLSSPAVQERVHKLEDAGIIAGYHAKVNPKALGLSILAITRLVNVASDIKDYLAETAQARPEVLQCYQVTGQDEFILHIVVESMEHLRDVLRLFSPHAQLITSIVINTPVANRIISFENLPNIQENNL